MSILPKIYLALDNCFAIKRWTRPAEWMGIAKELGFNYVQASTDNEIDPLFSTKSYMDRWFEEAEAAQRQTGVTVATFYTGYQTYRTMGLCHHDQSMVHHLVTDWIAELGNRAADFGARGLGFSFWAVPEAAMQIPEEYERCEHQVVVAMQRAAKDVCETHKSFSLSFEQMYVPYQPPFTIRQTKRYLRRIAQSGIPVYVTLDTGHMIGQRLFQKPSVEQIAATFAEEWPSIWLGPDRAYQTWKKEQMRDSTPTEKARAVHDAMCGYEYMFADKEDTDEYAWIRALGKYSPIFHLQQTDGIHGGHAAFTPEANAKGIIDGAKLLRAIADSYSSGEDIIAPVDEVFLSFELFFANMATKYEIFRQLRQTVAYWRQYIPEDGMPLQQVLQNLNNV